MAGHYYLDRFSILNRCVVVEGWATDFDPLLTYAGEPLPMSVQRVDRPDLIASHGEEARHLGFALCAALPTNELDKGLFAFRFNAEVTLERIWERFAAPEDVRFIEMTAEFQDAVARRPGRFLEIGSRARSGNSYRHWFSSEIDYVGMDVAPGPNVDIVGDAHALSTITNETFDYIFSIAVFEHLLMPWKVALEMNKVMKTGGLALIMSHNAWPLHEEPWDFWRYSRESWQGLFNAHTGFKVKRAEYQYPASIVPQYTHTDDTVHMSRGKVYLASGCLVEKIGRPMVSWHGKTADVYNLGYSHA